MINRKVFIIKGYSENNDELIADEYYATTYSNFFQLPVGGAYYPSEIIYLKEPSYKYLENLLDNEVLDFGILVFIGHGAYQNNNQIFQLNSTEIIKAGQFTLRSNKQIIILESCRVFIENVMTVDLSDKIPAFENGGIFRLALTEEQSREIYDSHIKRCEPEIMICYACNIGEEAYNYIFSTHLLQHAMNWHLDSSRHCAILPADELTRLLWTDVISTAAKLGVSQYPVTDGCTNFPIAVSKF